MSFSSAFQVALENQIIYRAKEYPLLYWVIFCIFVLPFLRILLNSILMDLSDGFKNITKYTVEFMIFTFIMFGLLVYFTITKSYGLLIYPCIFTWLSTCYVIYIVYKEHKEFMKTIRQAKNENNISSKKYKKQSTKPKKPNKQKESKKSNFKKYKLINKNRVKDKNNNEDKK